MSILSFFRRKPESDAPRKLREQRDLCAALKGSGLTPDEAQFVKIMQNRLDAGVALLEAHENRLRDLLESQQCENAW